MNEEIRLFRSLHGEGAILCALIDGTPATSFPSALLEGGREPLAADLSANSFKLGVTQIAASMLGVGLDDLVQRDQKRRRRRAQILATFATAFSAVMGMTAYSAIQSRNDAELSRAQAEGLVEYMITDMRDQLEPLGKLEIMDGVGRRAVEYYDTQDLSDLPDESALRQAHARLIIAEVALDQGDLDRAKDQIDTAFKITSDVIDRNPDDVNAIYAHAQSEYWLGRHSYELRKYHEALPYWSNYAELTKRLYKIDSNNFDWILERGNGANNLGFIHNRLGDTDIAEQYYIEALPYLERAVVIEPKNSIAQTDLANLYEGLARIMIKKNDKDRAWQYRKNQISFYDMLLSSDENNFLVRFRRVRLYSLIIIDRMLDQEDVERNQTIRFTLEEYDKIIRHDPSNENWKQNYRIYLLNLMKLNASGDLKGIDMADVRARHVSISNN